MGDIPRTIDAGGGTQHERLTAAVQGGFTADRIGLSFGFATPDRPRGL
ncbi:hypothetical protein [Crateriforma conspicua]|nr:hypothetical protein [Crateriforma conspicua]